MLVHRKMGTVTRNPLFNKSLNNNPLWIKYNRRNLSLPGMYKRLLLSEGSGYPSKLSKAYEIAKDLLDKNLFRHVGSLPSREFKLGIVKIAVNKIKGDITPSKLKNFYKRYYSGSPPNEKFKKIIQSAVQKKLAGRKRKELTTFGKTNFGKGLPTNVFRKIVTSTFK